MWHKWFDFQIIADIYSRFWLSLSCTLIAFNDHSSLHYFQVLKYLNKAWHHKCCPTVIQHTFQLPFLPRAAEKAKKSTRSWNVKKIFKTKWSIYAKQKQRIYLFMNPLCLTFCDLDKQNQLLFTIPMKQKIIKYTNELYLSEALSFCRSG